MHYSVVALEGIHFPVPQLTIPAPHTASLVVHQTTTAEQGLERIKDADIVICTRFPFTAALLDVAVTPKLKFIAQIGTGYDNIDIAACRKRGLAVANTPGANADAVAEHAIALFFAVRRNIAQLHARTIAGEWKQQRSITKYMRDRVQTPPIALSQEICGIVGYGRIGRRVARLMQGLGVKVVVASRQRADFTSSNETFEVIDATSSSHPPRTPLANVLKRCTTIILACPLLPETTNIISSAELAAMRVDAVVVNVGRGGVIDEAAMVEALNSSSIAGHASDVFEVEPTGQEESPLFRNLKEDAHFVASPHVAWFSEVTIANITKLLADNIEAWISGQPINLID